MVSVVQRLLLLYRWCQLCKDYGCHTRIPEYFNSVAESNVATLKSLSILTWVPLSKGVSCVDTMVSTRILEYFNMHTSVRWYQLYKDYCSYTRILEYFNSVAKSNAATLNSLSTLINMSTSVKRCQLCKDYGCYTRILEYFNMRTSVRWCQLHKDHVLY